MALYVCNCGRNYGTPEERTVHMAICHVMDVYRERDKLKAEVERLRGEKQNVMDCEPRKPSCGWCVACQRQKNSDLELQINVYREELERQKNKNRGMGSIVADEILKRIQSRLEDTEKSEKGIDVDGLRDQIEWFRHYSGVESDPCPACVYKEGVLQTACGVHKTIATLELQLNAIKEEWDKNCEHWCIHGETGPCDMVELINKISREGAEGRGTKSENKE